MAPWAALPSRRCLLTNLLMLSHQKKTGNDKPCCKPAKELGNGSTVIWKPETPSMNCANSVKEHLLSCCFDEEAALHQLSIILLIYLQFFLTVFVSPNNPLLFFQASSFNLSEANQSWLPL